MQDFINFLITIFINSPSEYQKHLLMFLTFFIARKTSPNAIYFMLDFSNVFLAKLIPVLKKLLHVTLYWCLIIIMNRTIQFIFL